MPFDFDFGAALNRKYDILGQNAAAANTSANAAVGQAIAANRSASGRAALDLANAKEAPGLAASEIGLRSAQGGYFGAETGKAQAETNEIPANAAADRAAKYGVSGPAGALLGGGLNIEGDHTGTTSVGGYSHGTAHVPASTAELLGLHQKLLAAKQGATRVPGKGPSTVDTVPAMLAPREAVLNEHAADLIGRDKIAAANAIGVAHQNASQGAAPAGKSGGGKGMIPAKAQGRPGAPQAKQKEVVPKHQKLAAGTHMVGHGKSAKTPNKIDPQALLSLMGSMQGGAPQGAPAPMPAGRGMV